MSPCSFKEQWQLQLQFLHLVASIFLFLNLIEVAIAIFRFPFTTILYAPRTRLYLPIERNFILHRERWNTPD